MLAIAGCRCDVAPMVPLVSLLLCQSQGVGASGLSSRGLLGIPGGKLGSRIAAESLELLLLDGSHGQLEANAVRVEEIDGIDEVVISDTRTSMPAASSRCLAEISSSLLESSSAK